MGHGGVLPSSAPYSADFTFRFFVAVGVALRFVGVAVRRFTADRSVAAAVVFLVAIVLVALDALDGEVVVAAAGAVLGLTLGVALGALAVVVAAPLVVLGALDSPDEHPVNTSTAASAAPMSLTSTPLPCRPSPSGGSVRRMGGPTEADIVKRCGVDAVSVDISGGGDVQVRDTSSVGAITIAWCLLQAAAAIPGDRKIFAHRSEAADLCRGLGFRLPAPHT